jgi:Holliday junction DNA helicase RuvA
MGRVVIVCVECRLIAEFHNPAVPVIRCVPGDILAYVRFEQSGDFSLQGFDLCNGAGFLFFRNAGSPAEYESMDIHDPIVKQQPTRGSFAGNRIIRFGMIAHLRGILFEKHPNQVIVESAGVGYDVQISVSTFTALGDVGSTVSLRIHTHVREDALLLFGFSSVQEKTLFERLISVSGIGPKLAITVLSGLPASDLITAIRSSDLGRLVRIPGVGKKTAERIVLELKDKVIAMEGAGKETPESPAGPALSGLEQDVLSALQNLGCSRPAAEEAVRKAKAKGAPDEFEALFRSSLALVR